MTEKVDNRGRETKYKPEYAETAYKLSLLGMTEIQIAKFFDVSESTFREWKHRHQPLADAISSGGRIANADVVLSLFKKATGYEHPDEKIFCQDGVPIKVPTTKHVQPDIGAIKMVLCNREPELWRDKQEHVIGGNPDAPIESNVHITPEQAYLDIVKGRSK